MLISDAERRELLLDRGDLEVKDSDELSLKTMSVLPGGLASDVKSVSVSASIFPMFGSGNFSPNSLQ